MTEKGCFIRVNSRSVKAAPYEVPLVNDSIKKAWFIHNSVIYFITDTGKFLQVPVSKFEYNVTYPVSMIQTFSLINKSLPLTSLVYVDTHHKKPTHLYVSDGMYCKAVPVKDITNRSTILMPASIKVAKTVQTIYKSGLTGDVPYSPAQIKLEHKSNRTGRLPKIDISIKIPEYSTKVQLGFTFTALFKKIQDS